MYNALTIHGLAMADQLPSSVLDIAHFWQVTAYNIGGLVYSLDDIEHGVLRGEEGEREGGWGRVKGGNGEREEGESVGGQEGREYGRGEE